ncbi:MAG: hypothetical protein WCJ64_21905 [Rhodospirillaceae bacterium]
MSNPVDQLKPLMQRLVSLAEGHDERLARLEAANSRLSAQIARIGEQVSRQSEQLGRLEEAPPPAAPPAALPLAAPAPAQGPGRPVAAGGRFGDQAGHLNEQITRSREQLSRLADHLLRIEKAQLELRDEMVQQGEDQQHLLETMQTVQTAQSKLVESQERLPLQVQRRFEAVLGIDGEEAERAEEAPKSEIGAVQEEIRQLGRHMSELVSQLGKLATPAAEPPKAEAKPKADAKPRAEAKAAAKPPVRRQVSR